MGMEQALKIQDRRGAVRRILDQIAKDGTMPVRTDWRTRVRAEDAGLFHFSAKRGLYRLGPDPTIEKEND
jgi:hypothetical protein